jgi:Fur family peroxide stress response transcriptional regulator
MESHDEDQSLITQLRKCKLRATGQRLAIMKTLMESQSHLSAEDIFLRLKQSHPTLSLSTVYKTLQVMAEMGAVVTIETGIGSLKFDGNPNPHHHAICSKCGKVQDVDFSKYPISTTITNILPNFEVQSVKVFFNGLCNDCTRNNDNKNDSAGI